MSKGTIIFYSDQILPKNEIIDRRFLDITGKSKPKLAYIPSASDRTKKHYLEKTSYYRKYGINDLLYFDLNKEYDPSLMGELLSCDAIHLSGGDPFQFLGAIKKRSFGHILKSYYLEGGILLGVSAGAIVLTPSVEISTIFYKSQIKDHEAVGMVNFHFLPHWNIRQGKVEEVKEFSLIHKTKVLACCDGGGIIIKNEDIELIGEITQIDNGIIKT